MQRKRLKLSTSIILIVCLVVLSSLLMTDALISNTVNDSITETVEEKAIVVSRTVAKSREVKTGLIHPEESDIIQNYTKEIQAVTEVSFIVVMDMNGIRKSHPNPELIGESFVGGDERVVLEGEEHVSISKGTLGKSLRAFTPIYDNGDQIGAVAVGIPLEKVNNALEQGHQDIMKGTVFGLLVGIFGAYMLSRYIKKILHGLEPSAIAKLLEERNTMLQSVHEGIVAVDHESKITLVNKTAKNIFNKAGLPKDPIGMKIHEYMPSTRLDKVLEEGKPEVDEEQNINGVLILVNRVPLVVNDQVVGAISTFRDKTEVNQLAEQLTGVKTYAESLRAQSHEFMNRLHVILGMIRMGYYNELTEFIHKIVEHGKHEIGEITANIKDPALAGFMMGKLSLAREENVKLFIVNKTIIPEPKHLDVTHGLITIIGNLIDNSIEALSSSKQKIIEVHLKYLNDQLMLEVLDTGPGLSENSQEKVFERGFSTKGKNRGYGLYLVKQSVEKLGGKIDIQSNGKDKTQFLVEIPYEGKEDAHD
ncbi:DcuS/MalK family sensor histidine kinase [Metabacillus arenae]|uniref:histidine kinase n=1 Tax=Metabacillus arenae TaxID=2771434 RepID=A0A926NLZ8_9BACI|nr:DcuS/MalK family sensor histidine kinase [Metabacillus arenae]MBD1382403.1 two-component system sensor histidine kinase DcuS [Metabacillus arenae]